MNNSAATAPDIIYDDTFQIRSDAAAGYLQPIDEYVTAWEDWDQYSDNVKQAGAGDDGVIYGVSTGTDTRGLYFQKDVFAAAGLPDDWQPGNWLAGDNAWPEWEDKMGFAAMPTQNGQAPGFTSLSGGWTLAVGANCENPKEAFDFIAVALNQENSRIFYSEAGQIAVRADVAEDPEYLGFNSSFEFFSSLVEYTHFRPATPDYSQISSNIPVATESVATGQASPEEAAAAYDAALIRIVGEEMTTSGN